MWKMLGTIQFIVHLPMIGVAFPSNAEFAFSFVVDLANLKIINVDFIIEKVLGIKKKATKESNGYSANMIESLGLVAVFLVLIVGLTFVGLLVYRLLRKAKIIKKLGKAVADRLLFNAFIRTFIASYIVFALSSFKALTSTSSIANQVLTYSTLCLVILAPFASCTFLLKYKGKLGTPQF